MLERLLAPAWPPIVATLLALVVFAGILLTTPPGFASVRDVLLVHDDPPRLLQASYALGAAASLALATLVMLAPLFAVLDVIARAAARQVRSRSRSNQTKARPA